MFDRDSLWFGILIGIVLPIVMYIILYGAIYLYGVLSGRGLNFDQTMLMLISPVINLFFIRYYFVSKKYDDTGRGVLLVTFVYVISYFVIN